MTEQEMPPSRCAVWGLDEHKDRDCDCTFWSADDRTIQGRTARISDPFKQVKSPILGVSFARVPDHQDLRGIVIDQSRITGSAVGHDMRYARITDSQLCDMRLASRFYRAHISRSTLKQVVAKSLACNDTRLEDVVVSFCSFEDASLSWTRAKACKFEDTSFDEASMKNMLLDGCTFERTTFSAANLDETMIRGTALVDCNFASDCSSATGTDFSDSVLERCDFTRVSAGWSFWDRALLSECSFKKSKLESASFIGAVLKECDFTGANIKDCNFDGAVFTRCVLDATQLQQANFRGAVFVDCTFRRSVYDDATIWPDSFVPPINSINESEQNLACAEARDKQPDMILGPVFIPAPNRGHTVTWAYALYPSVFEVFREHFAFARSPLARATVSAIDKCCDSLRVGDGVMPFKTPRQQMECIAVHLGSAVSEAALYAHADHYRHEAAISDFLANAVKKSFESSRRKAKRSAASAGSPPT